MYELSLSQNHTESVTIPKLKINYDRQIIYFNNAALPLLETWGCLGSRVIPESILQNHPEVFNRNANGFCKIPVNYEKNIMHFMVVPFPEAGYIGFYGESVRLNGLRKNTRQATL